MITETGKGWEGVGPSKVSHIVRMPLQYTNIIIPDTGHIVEAMF